MQLQQMPQPAGLSPAEKRTTSSYRLPRSTFRRNNSRGRTPAYCLLSVHPGVLGWAALSCMCTAGLCTHTCTYIRGVHVVRAVHRHLHVWTHNAEGLDASQLATCAYYPPRTCTSILRPPGAATCFSKNIFF